VRARVAEIPKPTTIVTLYVVKAKPGDPGKGRAYRRSRGCSLVLTVEGVVVGGAA